MKRLSYRWSALLSLALVAWLWLAAVHVHVDADNSASHPVCELCAGLDHAAAPPPATLPALLPQARLAAALPPTATAVTASASAHYSSRAPPQV